MNLVLFALGKPLFMVGVFTGFLTVRHAVSVEEHAVEAQKLPAAQVLPIEEAAAPPRPAPARKADPEEAPNK